MSAPAILAGSAVIAGLAILFVVVPIALVRRHAALDKERLKLDALHVS